MYLDIYVLTVHKPIVEAKFHNPCVRKRAINKIGFVNFRIKRMGSLNFRIKRMDSLNFRINRMGSLNFGTKRMDSLNFELREWVLLIWKTLAIYCF